MIRGQFGYRINALYEDGDTSIENQSRDNKLISATFDYDISDKANVILNLMHRKQEIQDKPYFFFTGVDRPSTYDSSKLYGVENPSEYEADRVMAKLNWNINDIFSTRLAYHYFKEDRIHYISMNTLQADGTFTSRSRYRQFDYEGDGAQAYLDVDFDTGSISHMLTVGASQSYGEQYNYQNYGANQVSTGLSLSGLQNLGYMNSQNPDGKYLSSESKDTNILIGDDITFNEQYSALVGLNYLTIEQKSYDTSGDTTSDYDKSATTPTLSLIYKPFNGLTTYLSYIEGLGSRNSSRRYLFKCRRDTRPS